MNINTKTTSNLLFNEEPLIINKLAARVIGLNEAIVLQQVHYWIGINIKAKINSYDNKTWTYNTYEKWQENDFDFWSVSTLKRIFKSLFDKGILVKGNYNKHKYDRKLWVSINYDKLDELLEQHNIKTLENVEISTKCQNDTMSDSNIVSNWNYGECQNDTKQSTNLTPPITETNTETNTEISLTTESVQNEPVVETNKELIESKTHLLLDSKNKIDKVSKWKKDRLIKSIDIFLNEKGTYFSFLQKIYNDDKNFAPETKRSCAVKTRFHNITKTYDKYNEEELEMQLKESQKSKSNNKTSNDEVTNPCKDNDNEIDSDWNWN